MHLILPLAFTISPLFAWASGWFGLTVLIAAVVLPIAEWWVGPGSGTAPSPRWGQGFPRLILTLVLFTSLGLATQASSLSN